MDKYVLSYESARRLLENYGSPLYVYSEDILKKHANELLQLLPDFNCHPSFSIKANSNIELVKIIGETGYGVDVMSLGELYIALKAGISKEQILFMCNSSSEEEMRTAKENGVLLNVDSLMQLQQYCALFPDSDISIRINPGIGDGHHQKVVTGGAETKFGINIEDMDSALEIAAHYHVKIYGLTHHIGSCFLNYSRYIEAADILLQTAAKIKDIKYINFGGGMGIPYDGEARLDLCELSKALSALIESYSEQLDLKQLKFGIQPGRYVVAEAGVLVGTINNIKENGTTKYLGTDIGFNIIARPIMYNSYHKIDILSGRIDGDGEEEVVDVVGNICESGDVLAHRRRLPHAQKGDLILVSDAGAYGYSMASNYNGRLRPAEVLNKADGFVLIRKRDSYSELLEQI